MKKTKKISCKIMVKNEQKKKKKKKKEKKN